MRLDDEQLRQHVIRRIAGGVDRNDVILEICQARGLGWREAEALVGEIASTTTGDVARRRFPLFAFLAAGVILGGLGLIANFIAVLLMPLGEMDFRSGTNDITQAGA
jgi:hypothetical protein